MVLRAGYESTDAINEIGKAGGIGWDYKRKFRANYLLKESHINSFCEDVDKCTPLLLSTNTLKDTGGRQGRLGIDRFRFVRTRTEAVGCFSWWT